MSALKPKICHLLHGLGVGGAEMVAIQLARHGASAYRVLFVCLDELGMLGREMQRQGFTITVLNRGPGLDWGCAMRLGHFLRREKIDLIHAHQYTPFFYALLARWLHRR